eukprot:TRINITY_DN16260_c0_g3_i1.p1 TRINITY_DN16260_c0_g3~~TRINITY_DN16260_c0_g3_i1.p1  ORF type:complete len:711 (+),score=195.30 TRINITY_DN16260_c0_g3_i1:149-2281(+)
MQLHSASQPAFVVPPAGSLRGAGPVYQLDHLPTSAFPPSDEPLFGYSHSFHLEGHEQGNLGQQSVTRVAAFLLAGTGGLVTGVIANRQRRRSTKAAQGARAHRVAVRATGEDAPAQEGGAGIVPTGGKAKLDVLEDSVSQFDPKVRALLNQAEQLRSNELASVITTMKGQKTELRSAFNEVDTLLVALIDSIHGLRESAVSVRKSDLRQQIEDIDRSAQAWVGDLEKGAVETLTGYNKDDVDTMVEVHVIGLSHHSAPVAVREKLAVAQDDWNAYAKELVEFARTNAGYMVQEVGVLSTCNRFELYFSTPELKKYPAIEAVYAFLRHKSGLSRKELDPFLFTHSGESAINHLFEVSSGLDSLVLGEAQILAQVKACHEHAIMKAKDAEDETVVAGQGGKIITKMLNAGIRVGKLVRTRTKIGKGSVSVSSAAVDLMRSRSVMDLKKQTSDLHICIIGAGKMGRLLLIALYSKYPDIKVTLVNRSVDKAEALLEELSNRGGTNAKVAPMTDMWSTVAECDVVFTATGLKDPIIMAEGLNDLEARRRMLIDIAVPRNIAEDCSSVAEVVSYTVDDLKKVVQANAEKRQAEVVKAKNFIGEEVRKFKLWQASQGAVPYLAALQSRAEEVRRGETEKMSRKLNSLHESERAAVDKLTRHIVDAMLEPLYYSMKDEESIDDKKNKILALRKMFRLQPLYKRRLLAGGADPPPLPA